ncbi:MAG: thioesterase family protein [Proteobacteria bacterium]|nr:thioesterase family protein [Pseudomonadota bacterium]
MTQSSDEAAILWLHEEAIRPEWIDYNRHLTEAFYVLIFGNATDAFLDRIGMDAAYRARTGRSAYTVEAHIKYLREVKLGETVRVGTKLLGFDQKRLRLHHRMVRSSDGILAAEEELTTLSTDTRGPSVVPFAPETLERLRALSS